MFYGSENLYCPSCDVVRPCTVTQRHEGPTVYFDVTCQACKFARQAYVSTVQKLRKQYGQAPKPPAASPMATSGS
jgi:hypothetical protein